MLNPNTPAPSAEELAKLFPVEEAEGRFETWIDKTPTEQGMPNHQLQLEQAR